MYTYSDCSARQSSRVLAQRYYRRANPQILAILFRRHHAAVFRLCYSYLNCRIEAEDAAMEIFEYLQKHLQTYRIKHFSSWLMRFSRNHCLQHLERQQRQHLPLLPRSTAWDEQQWEIRRQREYRLEHLHRAIDRLKRAQRDCILSFYFEERSYKEIALQLELSTAAVKSHIQNGKRNVRNILAREEI
jgi:RNA polymerase sigma-70 factor (ECF subfamily)